jgi:hypothetical protein
MLKTTKVSIEMSKKTTKSATATKAAAKIEKVTSPVEGGTDLIVLPPSALQLQTGEEILNAIGQDFSASDQIKQLTGDRKYFKGEARAKMAIAVRNLMTADEMFDATDVYAGEATWRKALAKIYVSLGVRNPDSSLTDLGLRVFPNPNANDAEKATDDYKRRKSVRDNFATLAKRSTRLALAAKEKGIKLSYNPDKRTLRLEGDKLPVSFAGKGAKSVDLTNEKMKGASERASFEAVMALADRVHDKNYAEKQAQKGGTNDVASIAHNAASSEKDLAALCNAVVTALNALNYQCTAGQRKIVQNLWDKVSDFTDKAKDV